MRTWRSLAVIFVFMLVSSACGSDSAGDSSDGAMSDDSMSDDSMADHDMSDDEMSDGDHGAMNMGDASATPAAEAGGDLLEGSFAVLETRPEGYDELTGEAAIARHDAGTTITISLEGLETDVEYIAHLHAGPCTDLESPHYMFDLDGSVLPPNEIHLAFTSGADGSGFMTAENDQVAGPEGESVVVHRADLLDNKIACAQFG